MIIAVDFDGTIVEHRYPAIGEEIPFAIETLKKLQSEHYHRLILWTVRAGKELDAAVEYCRLRGLEFYAHNENYPNEKLDENTSRKLVTDLFIDDRNVGGLPDWGLIYQQITAPGTVEFHQKLADKKKKNIFTRIGEMIDRK
jgi:hypothetical protein